MSYRWPLGSAHVGVQLLPLGSLQKPEDVAEVGFLASEQARWITGQNMQADGGGNTGELLIDGDHRDPRVLDVTV